MKNILYIVFSCLLFTTMVSAQNVSTAGQETSSSKSKEIKPDKRYKKVYWGLKAGGGQMMWENDFNNYEALTVMPLNFGFFIEYRPIKYVAIETGASYFMGSFEGSIDAYSTTQNGVDSEGDNVEYRFASSDMVETQDLTLLNVPIALKLNAFAGNWEFFAKGGMEYRHALTASYNSSGLMTNHGYYAQWDLLVDNLYQQGFYSNRYTNESGDITWTDTFEPFVGGGIVFPSRKTSFFIEGIYYLGSGDFTEKQTSPFVNRINNAPISELSSGSLMEMGTTKMSGFMVNIGLRF
ncbi:hypothetical protein [Carboxylicivirga sp. M1479]|uniref:hypothetical protein n=1 Tax=Carboxylicivirga sp. M1479 TaxID=2594476 RepID=UPI001177353E|nr:hypothetical protein [Carboxylicivirga sp. M1479]TRX66448.1 hypothetical protein FNN09_13105 [Carboxylicivirga sp. M1479]